MVDQGVNYCYVEDYQGIDLVIYDGGQCCGGQQYVNQYVVKVGEKVQLVWFVFFFWQCIWFIGIQVFGGVCGI